MAEKFDGTNWNVIEGQYGLTYQLDDADFGASIRSKISYVDQQNTLETVYSNVITDIILLMTALLAIFLLMELSTAFNTNYRHK